jgi:hypothetical protein
MVSEAQSCLRTNLELLDELSNSRFKAIPVSIRATDDRTEPCVKFSRSRLLCDEIHIRSSDAGAGNDDDAPARLPNERGELRLTFDGTTRPAGSQNPSRARLDHLFKRLAHVDRNVESTVKGHWQWPHLIDQFPGALDVHTPIAGKDAKDHAVHAHFYGSHYLALHLRKLSSRIDVVARARPDHRKDRQAHLFADQTQQFSARCESAARQVTAQFDPMRATALRSQRPIKPIDSDFQNVRFLHRVLA